MAVWDDCYGMRLYPSEDNTYQLEADAPICAKIAPFLELKVVGSTPLPSPPGETKKMWTIPSNKFPYINYFLSAFHFYREHDFNVRNRRDPSKTFIHRVTDAENQLLTLLSEKVSDKDKDVMINGVALRDTLAKVHQDRGLAYSQIKPKAFDPFAQVDDILQLQLEYVRIRDGGVGLKYGDIIISKYFDYYIYDGKNNAIKVDNQTIPKEFPVPDFPVSYFNIGDSMISKMYFNRNHQDLFMEFNDCPKEPGFTEPNISSLDMEHGRHKFSIYFQGRNARPTYDHVMHYIDDPHIAYYIQNSHALVYRVSVS